MPRGKRKLDPDGIYECSAAFAADGLPGVIARGTRGVTPRRVLAGEGMLTPVRDTTVTYESGRSELLKAGVTRLAPDHRLVRMRPELFVLACKNDRTKARARFRHLLAVAEREVKRELEAESRPSKQGTSSQLPARKPRRNRLR